MGHQTPSDEPFSVRLLREQEERGFQSEPSERSRPKVVISWAAACRMPNEVLRRLLDDGAEIDLGCPLW